MEHQVIQSRRLSLEITKSMQDALREGLPHGFIRAVFIPIVADVCEQLKDPVKRTRLIAAAVRGKIKVVPIMESLSDVTQDSAKESSRDATA